MCKSIKGYHLARALGANRLLVFPSIRIKNVVYPNFDYKIVMNEMLVPVNDELKISEFLLFVCCSYVVRNRFIQRWQCENRFRLC